MTETEKKWLGRISEWRASGLSAEQFAAGKDFQASTLRWRAGQLAPKRDRADTATVEMKPTRPVALARVVPSHRPMPGAAITITVGRAHISVARGFDAELLRDVVISLGEGS